MAAPRRVAVQGTAYEADASAWALEQADHLRAGRWSQLDTVYLADEIEALARSDAAGETGLDESVFPAERPYDPENIMTRPVPWPPVGGES